MLLLVKTGEKMIFRVLLLISFIASVSESLVMNVIQTHYQAEQNHSITLEWTFTTKPDTSPTIILIFCELVTDLRISVLLHLQEGVEVSESQDHKFSGQVQFDRDKLREGLIRLQLSRLRTDDSGLYVCKVRTSDGLGSGRCRLNVTVNEWPRPRTEPESQNSTLWERVALYCGLGLSAAPILVACYFVIRPSWFGRIFYSRINRTVVKHSASVVDTHSLFRRVFTFIILRWILENLLNGQELTLSELLLLGVSAIVWYIVHPF